MGGIRLIYSPTLYGVSAPEKAKLIADKPGHADAVTEGETQTCIVVGDSSARDWVRVELRIEAAKATKLKMMTKEAQHHSKES